MKAVGLPTFSLKCFTRMKILYILSPKLVQFSHVYIGSSVLLILVLICMLQYSAVLCLKSSSTMLCETCWEAWENTFYFKLHLQWEHFRLKCFLNSHKYFIISVRFHFGFFTCRYHLIFDMGHLVAQLWCLSNLSFRVLVQQNTQFDDVIYGFNSDGCFSLFSDNLQTKRLMINN